MNKLRVSYSLLNMWDRGNIDLAISNYLHIPTPQTKAMSKGQAIHKKIEKHIKENNQFPEWFFDHELVNPKPEEKLRVEYNDKIDLTGVIDCLDEPYIFEFKTGSSNSLKWAGKYQVPIYFLLTDLAGIKIEKAYVIRYNENEKSDYTLVWNSPVKRELARGYIDSLSSGIYNFFEKQGLLDAKN